MKMTAGPAALDIAASASFAAAAGFAAVQIADAPAALCVAAGAFLLARSALRRVPDPGQRFALPEFDLAPLPDAAQDESFADELLLTDEYRLLSQAASSDSEVLLLEDVLMAVELDSRVVRLFAAQPLPTAGELGASIDRHLHSNGFVASPPDATQALSDALAELRRSLR